MKANPQVWWYSLSHGIPAESFATGANQVSKWDCSPFDSGEGDPESTINSRIRNINMAYECNPKGSVEWVHSYFIQMSYFDTSLLYEKLVEHIGSKKQRKGSGK